VPSTNQHYLPASLIGGFGARASGIRLREAQVVVRRKRTGRTSSGLVRANNLAARRNYYRLQAPLPGVDPDVVDRLWNPVEGMLPDLVARLEGRTLVEGDDTLIFSYVATAAVRHPTFEEIARQHQAAMGLPTPSGDEVQYLRVEALRNQLGVLPSWRWRVLHSPDDEPRFMITDRGWMYVGEPGWNTHGLFLPMSPRVALLGYLEDGRLPPRRAPFEEHLYLCHSWILWFNAAAWSDPFIEMLIAHPDDRQRLEQLPDHRDLRVTGYGPFRYRRTSGLFD
jgi:hypothetical protein